MRLQGKEARDWLDWTLVVMGCFFLFWVFFLLGVGLVDSELSFFKVRIEVRLQLKNKGSELLVLILTPSRWWVTCRSFFAETPMQRSQTVAWVGFDARLKCQDLHWDSQHLGRSNGQKQRIWAGRVKHHPKSERNIVILLSMCGSKRDRLHSKHSPSFSPL